MSLGKTSKEKNLLNVKRHIVNETNSFASVRIDDLNESDILIVEFSFESNGSVITKSFSGTLVELYDTFIDGRIAEEILHECSGSCDAICDCCDIDIDAVVDFVVENFTIKINGVSSY